MESPGNGRGTRGSGREPHTAPMSTRRRPVSSLLARLCVAMSLLGLLVCWCVPSQLDGVFPVPQLAAVGPWYALPALAGLLLALRAHRRAAALVALASLAVHIAIATSFWIPSATVPITANEPLNGSPAVSTAATASLRVMTLNAYRGQADAQAVAAAVRGQGVEVLCLQETTATFTEALEEAGLGAVLPYRAGSAVGNQIWSSLPLEGAVADAVGYPGSAMPAATVELADGMRVRLVSVHTCSPSLGYEDLWHYSLAMVAKTGSLDGGRDGAVPYLLAGDFNATLYHASFRAVLAEGFSDGALQAGEGMAFTWPANAAVGPLVALDHILLADGLAARGFVYVEIPGSDHLAVVATVTAG